MSRVSKGTHHAARHSMLDELTFNRDFDHSHSLDRTQKWKFQPSYSGFATQKVRQSSQRRLPVNMVDTFLSDTATSPQIVARDSWRTNMMIKSNPTLRGFVTDKVTNVPHQPAILSRPPSRVVEHTLVHDHEHELLLNITTPSPYKFSPNSPLFRPLGSVPPATHVRPKPKAQPNHGGPTNREPPPD